jgi:hypothetical protein
MPQHPQLFEERFAEIGKKAFESASHEDKSETLRSWGTALDNILSVQTMSLTEDYFRQEAAATVKLDGKPVNYRYSSVLLVNEQDRLRRREIFESQHSVMQDLWKLQKEAALKQEDFIRKQGFEDYQHFYTFFNEIDYPAFAGPTRNYLDQTRELYLRVLDEQAQKWLGVGVNELEQHDLGFIRRGTAFDKYFPADRLEGALQETLKGLGIDLAAQQNIRLDFESREGKMPRAFCMPVRIPNDVRVVHLPQGGLTDYHTVFHEMGHAEHFANTDESLPTAFKLSGDRGITEGYAFLLQSLIYEPKWIKQFLGVDDPDLHRYNWFSKMLLHRALSARSLYELELRKAGPSNDDGLSEKYLQINEQQLGVKFWPDRFRNVDEGYYTADYVRAWFYEAQLRRHLQKTFGEDWWNHKDAGAKLKEIWSSGRKLSVDQALAAFVGEPFSTDALQEEFERFL